MQQNESMLDTIEPEVVDMVVSRREAIRRGASAGSSVMAALALGSVPVALAALAKEGRAQGTVTVQQVIDFALKLEILENEFYKAVLGTSSSGAQNAAFAPVRSQVPASAVPALQKIQQHEAAHVAFLTAAGAKNTLNLTADSFDFTGGQGSGTGPFAQATANLQHLLLVAQAAEDTGVRAYKGQAGNLMSNAAVLEAALRIHSVEARHAAKIRRLRRGTGSPDAVRWSGTVRGEGAAAAGVGANVPNPPAAAVSAITAIYAGEAVTTQGSVNLLGIGNLPSGMTVTADSVSEAFDEPLTMAQVVAIVQPFFKVALT